ncbi:MAG: PH domain-containing protein [Balneolaceae bacterium]
MPAEPHAPADAPILMDVTFDPRLKTYIYGYVSLILIATIVGVALLPFWLLFGFLYLDRYFSALECHVTTRSLYFKKGVLFQTERTIPFDKIQDLTYKEGPLLRALGLSSFYIETAGQSKAQAYDMTLIGIQNARAFRALVMQQRDKVTDNTGTGSPQENHVLSPVLSEILETLKRIEANQKP